MQGLNIIKCDKLDEGRYHEYEFLRKDLELKMSHVEVAQEALGSFMQKTLIELAGEQPTDNSILPSECLRERRALKILDNGMYLVYYP